MHIDEMIDQCLAPCLAYSYNPQCLQRCPTMGHPQEFETRHDSFVKTKAADGNAITSSQTVRDVSLQSLPGLQTVCQALHEGSETGLPISNLGHCRAVERRLSQELLGSDASYKKLCLLVAIVKCPRVKTGGVFFNLLPA